MKNKKNWLILLIVLNIGFIWGNSMMNPDKSHEFSNFVYDLLGRLLALAVMSCLRMAGSTYSGSLLMPLSLWFWVC